MATWHDWDAAGHDLLVVSSYRDGGGTARLFGIDAATGKHVGAVAIAPTHAGGIAITNAWAFVQGTDSGNKGAYEVPTKTQGLLVTKDHFIYSTSLGNDNRSNIYVVAGSARDIDIASTKRFRAPSMADGITADGATAYLVYESDSQKYIHKAPRNITPNLHKAKIADIVSF